MTNIIRVKTDFKINMDASAWELYTDMDNVEWVAQQINKNIEKVLNENSKLDAESLYEMCEGYLFQYSKFGSSDTEPRGILRMIIKEFKENH